MGSQYGDVAQVGERYVRNVQVRGSNPLISTLVLICCHWKLTKQKPKPTWSDSKYHIHPQT